MTAHHPITVSCATCGALPGDPCITRDGDTTRPHTERVRTARRAQLADDGAS